MARPLFMRFRDWLSDKFGLQYAVPRRKPKAARNKDIERRLQAAVLVAAALIRLSQHQHGRALLLWLLLLIGVVATHAFSFLI